MHDQRRHIAHMDLDSFYVSVELLRRQHLRGLPLLIGDASVRGVVVSCSYEARKFGIHSAMPMKTARRLCPQAVIVPGDMRAYAEHSALVTDIIRSHVPLFEKSSIDEFYLDLTGMERYFGCMAFMRSLAERITRESGLPVSFALASNKLVSKIATNEVKPNGQTEVPFGEEKIFLAPLPVNKLPGVGKKTADQLAGMGIRTMKDLTEMSTKVLTERMGKSGLDLHRRAQGIDDTPIVPFHEQKSVSKESTFSEDRDEADFLHARLVSMTEQIGHELRGKQKLAGCVTVKIKYENFMTFTKQKTIPYTNSDQVLIETANLLFAQLYDKRRKIRLLGVRLSGLVSGNPEKTLFDDPEDTSGLYEAIDNIKKKFGESLLIKAASMRS